VLLCGAVRRHRSLVAVARVIGGVHMAVEVGWAVEPVSRSDKATADEPLRAIVAVGCAVVGCKVIVP
jgi:hypothetical protein